MKASTYVIHGKLPSKKNSHAPRRRGRSLFVGNSDVYLAWANAAIMELMCQRGSSETIPKSVGLAIALEVYLAKGAKEIDLDNALGGPMDVLQGAGVVENDRQFKIGSVEYHRDPVNPRVEILIWRI